MGSSFPMQHYSMGGIRTKPTGESQNLNGLFVCGEASCWDMHGFNRLGETQFLKQLLQV